MQHWKKLAGGVLGGGALLAAAITVAHAAYPERPVRVVVPFPAGGSPDAHARVLVEGMAKYFDGSMYVEARPGAGGIIGTNYVARAQPDGYTLIMASLSHVTNPLLSVNANWDPVEDFEGIAEISAAPAIAVVTADFPASTLDEFVAEAKKRPGEINYLMPGRGTSMHLNSELLRTTADIDIEPVAYQGLPSGMPDLLTGRVSFAISQVSLVASHLESGALTALAVAAPRRLDGYPDLPTFTEAGYPDAQVVSWAALLAPKGTPQEVVAKLNRAANQALADPEIRARFERMGVLVAEPNTPQEVDAMLAREYQRWQAVFPQLGLERQ